MVKKVTKPNTRGKSIMATAKRSSTSKGKKTNRSSKLVNLSRYRIHIFVIIFGLIGSIFIYKSFAATPNATAKMGVFRGAQSPSATSDYETWLNRPVTYALGFYGRGAGSFASIDDPGGKCRTWAPTKYTLVLSTAMLPSSSYTLAAGAKGDYNSHWKSFGQKLVDNGCADITLRLGWEFNGKFYDWAAGGKEADYAAYWRQIVNTLRTVSGQSFRFDWCTLAGNTNANVEAAYPGDQYVDNIGLDAYDTSSVHTSDLDRWNNQVNRAYGLKWQKDFAVAHGKSISFPEWGITVRVTDTLGGGDNPYYIQKMYDWMNALPSTGAGSLAYHSYFEDDDDASQAKHALMNGQFPNSAAMFKKLFGVLPTTSTTDTTRPTMPTNLVARASSESQINLTWTASTDDKAVTSYDVYRNGAKIASPITASYSDTGLAAGTTYSYYVIARDAAGNSSLQSATVATTTNATPAISYKTNTYSASLNKYQSKTFAVSLPKAGTIKYSVSSNKNARYDLRVYDPSAKLVAETLNTTAPFNGNFVTTTIGTYKFTVTTKWWSSSTFTLNVTYPQ